MTWHVFDISSVCLEQFAIALGELTPSIGWKRRMRLDAFARSSSYSASEASPGLRLHEFPLQRGFYKPPVSWFYRFAERYLPSLESCSSDLQSSPLICTSGFYVPLAERWKGPVVYYQTDLVVRYEGLNPHTVRAMDIRMCRAAHLVCPNTQRVAEYLVEEAGCAPEKILIVPNATRQDSLMESPSFCASELPEDVAGLPRPIAGVIGNLAGNIDWKLLHDTVRCTPWLSWLFVGPTDMKIADAEQSRYRDELMATGDRVRFTGMRSYTTLKHYARGLDVALLPYRAIEPTVSGSPTRFYEHLAACRPMLGTSSTVELRRKEPLVRLVDSPEELTAELSILRERGFTDGYEAERWRVSQTETWTERASRVRQALVYAETAVAAGVHRC